MADRFFAPYFTPVDGNGDVYPGGKLFFYVTGTSTPLDTFSDDALSTPNTNPVAADGAGRWPPVFLSPRPYKVILQTAAGVQVWSADPYTPTGGTSGIAFTYDTRNIAAAAFIPSSKNFISTAGYATIGDGGAAMYKRVVAEPSHAGKFQSADGAWWELISSPVNPVMFGAVGDDSNDDTVAVNAALTFGSAELLKGHVYRMTADAVMSLEGAVLRGPGTIKLASVPGCTLTITANKVTVDGISVNTAPGTVPSFAHAVTISGSSVNFRNNRIFGYTTESLHITGSYVRIEGCWLDGETYYQRGSGIVFEGATNCWAHANRLHWMRGFGITTRLNANRINITDNICYVPVQMLNSPAATAGQTVFVFDLSASWRGFRHQAQKNGAPLAEADRTIVGQFTDTVTVTLAAGATDGDIVTLVVGYGLESINVNSQSYDILVSGNVIQGSGDSGIVACSDYHNGVIDPNNTVAADYPGRVNITGNVVTGPMAGGISMTNAVPDVSIVGNTCSNWSIGSNDQVYSAGIVCTYHGTVQGNTLVGNGTTTRFGVTLNGHPDPVSDGDWNAKFGGNQFSGTFVDGIKYHIPTNNPALRKTNIIVTDEPFIEYPEQINLDSAFAGGGGAPSNTNYLAYDYVSTGWVRDTGVKVGGVASVYASNGAYAQAFLSSKAMLLRTNLRVEFIAQATAGTGFFRIYTTLDGIEIGPPIAISGATWQRYTYLLALTHADQINNEIRIRAGADLASTAYFQHFRISYQRLP